VLGEKKCGGNAQYIKKDRWLHHTSFLWDYQKENMEYLLHPKKTPPYRQGRPHDEFLCRLSDYFPTKEQFIDKLKDSLQQRYLTQTTSLEEIEQPEPHRQATILIS
jgi:lipoate-protein ligase A